MYSKTNIDYKTHHNPQHALNTIKPTLFAMQVLLDMENNDTWTHTQRSKFNFVLSEMLGKVAEVIRQDEVRTSNAGSLDIGDIPF